MDKYRFIKDKFEEISDRDKADSMAKYMRNIFQFYGIPSPKRRETYKEFIREEKKIKPLTGIFLINAMEMSIGNFNIWCWIT